VEVHTTVQLGLTMNDQALVVPTIDRGPTEHGYVNAIRGQSINEKPGELLQLLTCSVPFDRDQLLVCRTSAQSRYVKHPHLVPPFEGLGCLNEEVAQSYLLRDDNHKYTNTQKAINELGVEKT